MTTRPTTGGLHGAAVRAAYAAAPASDLLGRYLDDRDEAAFRELVERFSGVVGRACRAVLGRDDLARDAFQETFLRLVEHGHALRTRAGLAAWLVRVARRTALNVRRREARQRKYATAAPRPAAPDPPAADEVAALRAALAALPERFRLPLELVYLDGRTHAEAAALLGQPKGTVDANVSRGLTRLRATLTTAPAVAAALPGAARAVPAEWVEATVRAAAAVVPRPAGLMGSAAAWWATRPTAALAWAGAAGLVACGLAAAALTAAPVAVGVASTVPPPVAESESLPARNKRVLEAEVLPKVVVALKPLALNGGEVAVTRVEAHDFRARFDVELRHRDTPPGLGPTGLRLFLDTRQGNVRVLFDLTGRGSIRELNLARPIIVQVPGLGIDWTLRSEPVAAAAAELRAFPPDPRAFAEADRHAAAVRAALGPYRGRWLYLGNPARVSTFASTLPAGPDDPFDAPGVEGDTAALAPTVLVLDADGRLRNWLHDVTFVLSADGRRLEWPDTDRWWVRAD